MFRNTRAQTVAVLAIGALLGYLAASGRLNPFQWARAAPPAPAAAEGQADCCDGAGKAGLLAGAARKVTGRLQKDAKPGTRPNIVFIMGDDVGWFNIGA